MRMLVGFVLLSYVTSTAGQSVCDQALEACGGAMYEAIDVATDNAGICTAVDTALACVAAETATCDLPVRAEISAAMNSIVDLYQGGDFQCSLANANDPAFTNQCLGQLSFCTDIYYEAQFTPLTSEACDGFERYKTCLQTNTTDCTDTSSLAAVQESINNVTTSMAGAPYYCGELDSYDVETCENGFYDCLDPLNNVGNPGMDTSSLVCGMLTTFTECVESNNVHCSPRLTEKFNNNTNNLTVTFQGEPYYCGSDNPCYEAFLGCNRTLSETEPAVGCGLQTHYETCLTGVTEICDVDKLDLTKPIVDDLMQQLETEFHCSATTTSTTTTDTSSTSVQSEDDATTSVGSNNGTVTPDWNAQYGGSSTVTSSLMTILFLLMTSQYM